MILSLTGIRRLRAPSERPPRTPGFDSSYYGVASNTAVSHTTSGQQSVAEQHYVGRDSWRRPRGKWDYARAQGVSLFFYVRCLLPWQYHPRVVVYRPAVASCANVTHNNVQQLAERNKVEEINEGFVEEKMSRLQQHSTNLSLRSPLWSPLTRIPVRLRVPPTDRSQFGSKDGIYNNVVVWLHGVGEVVRNLMYSSRLRYLHHLLQCCSDVRIDLTCLGVSVCSGEKTETRNCAISHLSSLFGA